MKLNSSHRKVSFHDLGFAPADNDSSDDDDVMITSNSSSSSQLPQLGIRCKSSLMLERVPLIWAVERWDPLTAHIDVCSKQSLIWAVGKIPKNCGFVLPLILMIAFSKH